MNRWTDEQWAIVMRCQDQKGHGYLAHAKSWSNHSLRYEPTLCDDCRDLIENLDSISVKIIKE